MNGESFTLMVKNFNLKIFITFSVLWDSYCKFVRFYSIEVKVNSDSIRIAGIEELHHNISNLKLNVISIYGNAQ